MTIQNMRVALDGPGGAGKSTIAKLVAKKAGLVYVDTGALYRTVGLYMARNGIGEDDTEKITAALPDVSVDMKCGDGGTEVYLNGENVTGLIRTQDASRYASAVSKIPEVRAKLLDLQRNIAAKGGVIMDGRDIGTVIIPDAELKIFMTATLEERAVRRFNELKEKGENTSYAEVLESIRARDRQDSEREAAPLAAAEDAVTFVNDGIMPDECADYIISLMMQRAEII